MKTFSIEHRKHISEKMKGNKNGSFSKGISRLKLKGVSRTDEVKRKISISHKGKKFSKEHIQKLREARLKNPNRYWLGKKRPEITGKNSKVWVNGDYKKAENKMQDSAYMNWSYLVKKRDLGKCRLLNNECKGRLESHHIYSWREYPTLRYVLTNGITLCQFHHPRGYEQEKRMIPIFQELLSVSKENIENL